MLLRGTDVLADALRDRWAVPGVATDSLETVHQPFGRTIGQRQLQEAWLP